MSFNASQNVMFGGSNILEEIVLRTACGCEKIVSIDMRGASIRVPIHIGNDPGDPMMGNFMVRDFESWSDRDPQGRPIYHEIVRDYSISWRAKYEELYKDVYGMDAGL